MIAFNVYKNLQWFNDLPVSEAEELLRECSGSELWARQMAKMRPFNMLEKLYEAADANWFLLPPSERILAFSALSNTRQAVVSFAGLPTTQVIDEIVLAQRGTELANAAHLYHEKFRFIFVLCASGKSSGELLAICNARLGNSVETELQIAAEEHRKIIEIRLNRLLEQ